ncbi:MAG: hypothetical protein Q8S13_03590 [Dehalococcoidia bacterium]|nr:hypothetical protein [Dehalococcoidia bacterium]
MTWGKFRLTVAAVADDQFDVDLRFDNASAPPTAYLGISGREVTLLLRCASGQHGARWFDTCPRCRRKQQLHAQAIRSAAVPL